MNSSLDDMYQTRRKARPMDVSPPPVRKKRRRKRLKRDTGLLSLVKDGLSPLRIREGVFNICSPILSILKESRDVSPMVLNLEKRSFLTPNSSQRTNERPKQLKRFKNGNLLENEVLFDEDRALVRRARLAQKSGRIALSPSSPKNSLINNINKISYRTPKSEKNSFRPLLPKRKASLDIERKFNLELPDICSKNNLISTNNERRTRSILAASNSSGQPNEGNQNTFPRFFEPISQINSLND